MSWFAARSYTHGRARAYARQSAVYEGLAGATAKVYDRDVKPVHFILGFAGSALVSLVLLACKPPEVEACEDFVAAAQECGEMNGDPRKELDDICDDTAVECREYFKCAAKAECKESGGVYRLEAGACTMPEGKECVQPS